MKRILLVVAVLMAASSIALGQAKPLLQVNPRVQDRTTTNDEEALKQLVKELSDAVVHNDLQKIEKFEDDNFSGTTEGISYDKKMFLAALRSGQLKVAAWTIDDVKVNPIRGNSAVVTGRSKLSNATYMGKDFSGDYEWSDRLVKQRDGSWRVISSQSKRTKQ